MSDVAVLYVETTCDVETIEVDAVFVIENENESQTFSQEELKYWLRDLAF